MKIALTGGIACGKSLAAKFFRELGVQVLDADDVVHELEAPGGAAVSAIVTRFGPSILAVDGGIDRAKLATIIFGGERRMEICRETAVAETVALQGEGTRDCARRDLEAILHPLVRKRLLDFVDGRRENGDGSWLPSAAIHHSPFLFRLSIIPLLFESHFDSDYDIIICVSTTEDRQIDRMMRTRAYTREQAEARLAAQMPVAEKAARADWTIHNNSTPEELKAEVQRCASWLSARMEKVT